MQPYFDPARKTTSKKNGRRPQKKNKKIKTTSKKMKTTSKKEKKKEDGLNKIKRGKNEDGLKFQVTLINFRQKFSSEKNCA
jgi:hypothetical protein